MPYCCVPFCTSGLGNATGLSFYAIPDKPEELKTNWFHAISQGIWSTSKSNKLGWLVCSKHFQPCDFTDGKLNDGAVPSLFLYKQNYVVRFKEKASVKQIQESGNGHDSTRNMKTEETGASVSNNNNVSHENNNDNSSILRSLLEKPHPFTLSVTYDGDIQDIQSNRQGSCHVCGKIFISSYYLNNHIMLYHYEQCGVEVNENVMRKVKFAILSGNSFIHKQTSSEVKQSTAMIDKIEGKQSDCYVCNNLLISHLSLQKHIEVCHKEELICKICSKICNNAKGLIIHKRIHLKDGLYLCDRCGKHLETNITHNGYNCSNCGYACFYHKDFNTDRKVHIKLSLYVCDLCNKKFDDWEKWQRHLKAHNNKEHICNICKRIFSEHRYLEFHRMIHIEGNCITRRWLRNSIFKSATKLQTVSGKHVCHLCGKILSRLAIMYNHIYAHAKKKKYLCEVCGDQFAYRTSLCVHSKRHAVIKPYACLCRERTSHNCK